MVAVAPIMTIALPNSIGCRARSGTWIDAISQPKNVLSKANANSVIRMVSTGRRRARRFIRTE